MINGDSGSKPSALNPKLRLWVYDDGDSGSWVFVGSKALRALVLGLESSGFGGLWNPKYASK